MALYNVTFILKFKCSVRVKPDLFYDLLCALLYNMKY